MYWKQGMKIVTVSISRKWDRLVTYWLALVVETNGSLHFKMHGWKQNTVFMFDGDFMTYFWKRSDSDTKHRLILLVVNWAKIKQFNK